MKSRIFIFFVLLCLLMSSVSCNNAETDSEQGIRIVATNFALYDFARAVCGDSANVKMLLKPGNEAHDYEVTIEDIALITSSDLFLYVGGESEDWVYDIFESLGPSSSSLNRISSIDLVEKYIEELPEGAEIDPESSEEDEYDYDEHVWTSISNAIVIIESIRDKLLEIDPDNSESYSYNADRYISALSSLSEEFEAVISSSKKKSIIIADRFPFRYMAEEYGLKYYAAFSGCSSSTEPSLSTVSFLTEKVKEEETEYIFIIEFSDGKTAKAISAETGARILTLHSAHNVSKEDFDLGITYEEIMKNNLSALKLALG